MFFAYLLDGCGEGSLVGNGQYLLLTGFKGFVLRRYDEGTAHLSQLEFKTNHSDHWLLY